MSGRADTEKTRRSFTVVALAFTFLTSGCGLFNSSLPTYRYRLTVNVDTPDGPRSGSGVVEVRTTKQGSWNIDSPGNISTQVFGEAVAVDLPNGKTLFAVQGSDWDHYLLTAYKAHIGSSRIPFEMRARIKQARRHRGVLILPEKGGQNANWVMYPKLVQFGNLSDPASAEWVAHDDLAAAFGPGYALRSVTVEVTSEPITTGIDRRLPWLGELKKSGGRRLDGSKSILRSVEAKHLYAGSFDFKNRPSMWDHL